MREPGYPIFLAAIFFVFGNSLNAVKLTNMFFAFVTAGLMTRIVRKLSSNQILIVVAPLLFLFHPGTLIAESRGGGEVLFALFLTLFVLTLYRAIESNRAWDYSLSGGVLGLTVLVRSTPMLFPLFLLAYLLLERHRNARLAVFRNIALMVMAMFLVLSPWIIRNYSLTGKFVPTASVVGVSAHTGQYVCQHHPGNNLWVDETLDREAAQERAKLAEDLRYPFKAGYYQSFYSSEDEVKFSKHLMWRVADEYRRSPMLFVRCVSSNLFNLWFAGKTWKSTSLNLIVQLPYLILASIGAVLAVRSNKLKLIAPLGLFIISYVAVYVPILAQARYSVPLMPFVSILACLTLVAAQRRLTGEDIEVFVRTRIE
jgi:4-amino-4-deoxy-L-arabinose transferase-like glycosyltransferase